MIVESSRDKRRISMTAFHPLPEYCSRGSYLQRGIIRIVNDKCEYLQHLTANVVHMFFFVTPIITVVKLKLVTSGVIVDCVAPAILNAYSIISECVIERNQCVHM